MGSIASSGEGPLGAQATTGIQTTTETRDTMGIFRMRQRKASLGLPAMVGGTSRRVNSGELVESQDVAKENKMQVVKQLTLGRKQKTNEAKGRISQ